jgi:uncharacterized protein (DUF1501 family)
VNQPHDPSACNEYNQLALSRRRFLEASGLLAAAAAAPAWLPRVTYAKDFRSSQRDVAIAVFLRGASDGLSMCVPWQEAAYYAARPVTNVPRPDSADPNRGTDLDGFFAFPPAMVPLLEAFTNGNLAVVHATGSTNPSRSHFEAQRYMEVGKPGDNFLATGWLSRHLATVAPAVPNSLLRGVGLATGLPISLLGAPSTLPIPDLLNFGLAGSVTSAPGRLDALSDMYAETQEPLYSAAETTLATINLLDAIDFGGYVPAGGAVYPNSNFGRSMKSVAALVKAQVGVEAVAIDVGGWDTHANQGTVGGTMANLMADVANTLRAFHLDMFSPNAPSTVTIVHSEFGRRLGENGTSGTDHGHGNCMLVLGNAVNGGRVVRNWPGLAPQNLFEGRDLAVTIDYRDVLAEIVSNRLGNQNLDAVFPGYTPIDRGILL